MDVNFPTVRTAWMSTLLQSGQRGCQLSYSQDSMDLNFPLARTAQISTYCTVREDSGDFKSFMSGQRRLGLPADQCSTDFNFLLARIARISTPSPDRTARAFV